MANREACELYIEQEIKTALNEGKRPWTIGKDLAAWVEKLFEVTINPQTLTKRAQRIDGKEDRTNVLKKSQHIENIKEKETPSIIENRHTQGGGAREGAGRPPKIVAIPDNTQFRTTFTGENEWYTPIKYIESVRKVLGKIDIDPATSQFGQSRIKATTFYDTSTNGLSHNWKGRMWLNPPYSHPLQSRFIEKAVEEFKIGNISEAIILTHNYTDTAWFHLAESVAELICFTKGRVKFERENGEIAAPTQGSAFFYFGNKKQAFIDEFKQFGFIR